MIVDYAPPVSIPSLQSQLSSIATDLSVADVKLTAHQHDGMRPWSGWGEKFSGYAERLEGVRNQFAQVRPNDPMVYRLGDDAMAIARMGGELEAMAAARQPVGSGWDTALDAPIANAQEAIRILAEISSATPAPY